MPHRQPNWLERSGGGAGGQIISYMEAELLSMEQVLHVNGGGGVNKCHFSCSKTAQVT